MDVYKFADDGTFKISEETLENCRRNMKEVLLKLDSWCRTWRLVMNCKKDKTEIVLFKPKGIAETQDTHQDICMGNKTIHIVKKSKVLGLIIDEELTFKEHSDMVYSQLNHRWVTICKYSNRNWGFNQRVIVRLLKTLFLSKLFYAGHVWINHNNIQEIDKLWYKNTKSAVGAVFNASQTLTEVITGLPPILTANKVNKIKHYLKLNIRKTIGDQFRKDLTVGIQGSNVMKTELHSTFKFLKWKLGRYAAKFNEQDKNIISMMDTEKFTELSTNSCSYSKKMMQTYTEELWQTQVNNKYLAAGLSSIPRVSCDKLAIPITVDRALETILLSHFYINNLMNSFLYRVGQKGINSPLCPCGREEQTPYHCMVECKYINDNIKEELNRGIAAFYKEPKNSRLVIGNDHITLLNMSRNNDVMQLMLNIIKSKRHTYRTKIIINTNPLADAQPT